MKWFTSDWHLNHSRIIEFSKRPFKNIEQMNDHIIRMVLETVKPGDELFFIGDIGYGNDIVKRFFDSFPRSVTFHWITGNHDKKLYNQVSKRVADISQIKGTTIGKQLVIMCHFPMLTWHQSHRNSWHLYGHHHNNDWHSNNGLDKRIVGKMLNVNLEFNNFKMYNEDDIVRIMDKKEDNWDFIKNE